MSGDQAIGAETFFLAAMLETVYGWFAAAGAEDPFQAIGISSGALEPFRLLGGGAIGWLLGVFQLDPPTESTFGHAVKNAGYQSRYRCVTPSGHTSPL